MNHSQAKMGEEMNKVAHPRARQQNINVVKIVSINTSERMENCKR